MIAERDIRQAHRTLHFICAPHAPQIFSTEAVANMRFAHEALAWVLGFPCAGEFGARVESARQALSAVGIELLPEPMTEDEARRRGIIQ